MNIFSLAKGGLKIDRRQLFSDECGKPCSTCNTKSSCCANFECIWQKNKCIPDKKADKCINSNPTNKDTCEKYAE